MTQENLQENLLTNVKLFAEKRRCVSLIENVYIEYRITKTSFTSLFLQKNLTTKTIKLSTSHPKVGKSSSTETKKTHGLLITAKIYFVRISKFHKRKFAKTCIS